MLAPSPTRVETHRNTIFPTERGWAINKEANNKKTRGSEERPTLHKTVLLWPLRVRVPRLPRRLLLLKEESDAVVVGDVEDVIADVLVTESDKE